MKKSQLSPAIIKIPLALILLMSLWSIGFTQSSVPKPTKYKSEVCKVKLVFPGEIKEDEPEVKNNATTYKVSTKVNENVYFFGATVHNTPLERRYELAEIGLESFVKTLKAELTSKEDYTYKKHKGVFGKLKRGEVTIHYKTILIGQHQYQLVAIFNDEIDQATSEKFFKSFKALK